MKLVERLKEHSVESLVRVACILALAGLGVMVLSVVYPAPLVVIFAMGGGHVIGGAAFACYLLSIVLDMQRASRRRSLVPPAGVAPAPNKD
jgi:hypothetical protein